MEDVKTDSTQSDVLTTTESQAGGGLSSEDLQKQIQSAVDKTASKIKKEYETKLTSLSQQLEAEKRAKMSEEELRKSDEAKFAETQKQFERERLGFELTRKAIEKELPPDLVDLWLNPPSSVDELEDKLTKMTSLITGIKSKTLEEFRKGNTRTPTSTSTDGKVLSRNDFEKLPPDARMKFFASGGKLE
jgi:hypothetical protein